MYNVIRSNIDRTGKVSVHTPKTLGELLELVYEAGATNANVIVQEFDTGVYGESIQMTFVWDTTAT